VAKFTIDYKTRQEHESRLRKTILHSADALPDRVAEYIRGASAGDRWQVREQILKTFPPLVDYLPGTFVDFALRELIDGFEEEGGASFSDMNELGIRGTMDYHPPAHVQGPFLRLLGANEDEGLRLIHGLTNAATAYWCGRERDERYLGYSRTPLPIVLRLPSGPKELWGNEEVYCWFRHTSVGPYAVISALMALEVWMEECLEAGRDADHLIHKVMAGSQSVAVLGVCVAIALAFPTRCLPGVLPFIAHPLVWRMDIYRRAKDLQGPPMIDFFGQHEHINQKLQERKRRPQRGLDIRNLVPLVLLAENSTVRAAFEKAFATFGEDLPFQFEEQKGREEEVQALRAEIEDYKGLLNRENYRQVQTGEVSSWRYEPPRKPTREEHERFEKSLEFHEYMGLALWAGTTLKSTTPPDPSKMAQVVGAARSYGRAEDFSRGSSHEERTGSPGEPAVAPTSIYSPDWCVDTGLDPIREPAIAAVAAAVASKAWDWAKQCGHADWCRSVLLAAARTSGNGHELMSKGNVFHLDHKLDAAKGLTALVAQGAGDAQIGQTVLSLVLDAQLQVVEAVFAGLRTAWWLEEVLYWNCLSLTLSISVVPGNTIEPGMGLRLNEAGIVRLRALWERHAMNLERGEKPKLPAIEVDDRGFFLWNLVGRTLMHLPLDELTKHEEVKAALLQLADGLLGWTISENLRGADDDDRPRRHSEAPREWSYFFMSWLAKLARLLVPDEAERHVFAPVRAIWPRLPDLTADLLSGLIRYQIARFPPLDPLEPETLRTWERVCFDLLARPELVSEADGEYLSRDCSEVVTLMVFVSHGLYVLKEEWPYGPTFAGIIGRWLEVVGTNHDAQRAFLTMLGAAWRHFPPNQIVGWLHGVASRSQAPWRSHNNGERTARIIHALWQRSRAQLIADSAVFLQFSGLVDLLAASGVTLASVIQQQLEGPHT